MIAPDDTALIGLLEGEIADAEYKAQVYSEKATTLTAILEGIKKDNPDETVEE